MKNDNYIVIHGWMMNELKLSGTELLLFAIIHGFSQDGESLFSGSLKYLQEATGKSRSTVIENIKKLIDKGHVIKYQEDINGVLFNKYRAVWVVRKSDGGGMESVSGGSTKTVPNNTTLDNTNDKGENSSLFPELDPKAETTFQQSPVYDKKLFFSQLFKEGEMGIDLNYYYGAVDDWTEGLSSRDKRKKKTARGWIAQARTFMRMDNNDGKLKMNGDGAQMRDKMSKFLNRS